MEVYSSEEEQLQAIKQWWSDNSKAIITGLVLGILALISWNQYTKYQQQKAADGSALYNEILSLTENEEFENIPVLTTRLREEIGHTAYANMAGLLAARAYVEKGELDQAASELQLIIDTAMLPEIKQIAQLRLARLYFDQDKLEQANSLAQQTYDNALEGLALELRGDIQMQREQFVEAKETYELAALVSAATGGNPILRLKKDQASSMIVSRDEPETAAETIENLSGETLPEINVELDSGS